MKERTTLKNARDAFRCRRRVSRTPVHPTSVTCWREAKEPTRVTAIETDVAGARLLLPWQVERGDEVVVSFDNGLGVYETRKARIAWSQPLDRSGRFVAGMSFDEELPLAV